MMIRKKYATYVCAGLAGSGMRVLSLIYRRTACVQPVKIVHRPERQNPASEDTGFVVSRVAAIRRVSL